MKFDVWCLRLAFAGLGITAAVFPATVPLLAAMAGARVDTFLPAVPTLFGGLLAGVVATAFVRPAWTHVALAVGGLLQALGLLGFALVPGPLGFSAMAAVAGLGFGLVEAAASTIARRVAGQGTTTLLTHLTVLVAASAALTPLLVAVVDIPVRLLAGLALVPAGVTALALRLPRGAPTASEGGRRWSLLPAVVVPAALCLFAYVGAESVLSGWSSVLTQRLVGLDESRAAWGTTAFWTLMGLGRLLSWFLLRAGVSRLIVIGGALVGGSVAAAVAAVLPEGPRGLLLVALVCVAIAPSYAFLLGSALERLPDASAARVTGPLVAVGSLGGTVIPGLVLAGGHAHALGWVAVLLAAVTLVAVAFLTPRQRRDIAA